MAYVHLSDEETWMIDDWLKKHDATCALKPMPSGIRAGMLGGRLTYRITPCSLGNLTFVECGCGVSLELPIEDDGVLIGEPKEHPAP